jgi:hypothetical protein
MMSKSLIEHYMKNGGRITRCPYKVPMGSEFSWHGAHPQDLRQSIQGGYWISRAEENYLTFFDPLGLHVSES